LEDGIPDAAYKPLTGDDKDVAKFYERANKDAKKGQGTFDFSGGRSDLPTAPLSAEFSDLRDLPEDTVEDVQAKAKAYRSLRKQDAFLRARMGCNLYTAAFLLPKSGDAPSGDSDRTIPTSQDVWLAVGQGKGRKPIMDNATAATTARALHWPLEFPDIMSLGGFDVVLGNPPWERIKLQEKEFFALRAPEIATAANKAARERLIKALREAPEGSPELAIFEQFEAEKRLAESTSVFVRLAGHEGGRFPFTGTGDVNTYQIFAELFAGLAGPKGRAGVIVPTGIATDVTTAPFFAHIVAERRLSDLVDFENAAPIFPAVHRSFKFSLLTLGRDVKQARFAFFLRSPSELADPERSFTLSPTQIERINPNTRNAPVFRSQWDAELTAKLYERAPVLFDENKGEDGNPWQAKFYTRIWHMAEDSEWFLTASELNEQGFALDKGKWTKTNESTAPGAGSDRDTYPVYAPLYEAKMRSLLDLCGLAGSPRLERALHFVRPVGASGA
jgi:hypothetical protein